MRISFLAFSFSFITLNVAAQDSAAVLKKFDEEMIHFYKRGYVKNGGYHKFSDLRLEMKPGSPSYDFYRQYKKNETNQLISSLFIIGGTILYLSTVNDNSVSANGTLFWTGIITTAIATGFSINFESKKIKFLTLAVKTRNREILAGTFK